MKEKDAVIRIGTASWSIPKSAAARFPQQGSILQRYGAIFNACEINSTFYRSHKADTYKRWAESVPDTFLFSVKLARAITHERRLDCNDGDLEAFVAEVSNLGPKLGPVLIQLPPSLRFDTRSEAFLAHFRCVYDGDAVIEPRHASWFTPDVSALLAANMIARAAVDSATGPDSDMPAGDSGLVYVRLHGWPKVYYSDYDPTFLDLLHQTLLKHRAPKIWCIFDNTALGHATENALSLLRLGGLRR